MRILMSARLLRLRGRSARSLIRWAGLLGVLGGASCSSEAARPPALGDCEAQLDAPCSVARVTVGAMAQMPEASPASEDDVDAGFDAAQCGSVVEAPIIASAEPTCLACVEQFCCDLANACSNDATCPTLLTDCATTGPSCLALFPTDDPSYDAFATCVDFNCPTTTCPTIPTLVTTDL